MPKETKPGNATTRRYSEPEKAAAVRMVRQLRKELGTDQRTVKRVAIQLGYGPESVRSWVRQADINEGHAPGQSTEQSAREKTLEQENRELRRANEILKRAATFFGAELDHYGVYGARKLWKAANRADLQIGRDQTARLMRHAGLEGVLRRRNPRTTTPDPGAPRHPDLVNREFTTGAPNRLSATDLTYVPTWVDVA